MLGTEQGPSLEPFLEPDPKHRTWSVEGSSPEEDQSAVTEANGWWEEKQHRYETLWLTRERRQNK